MSLPTSGTHVLLLASIYKSEVAPLDRLLYQHRNPSNLIVPTMDELPTEIKAMLFGHSLRVNPSTFTALSSVSKGFHAVYQSYTQRFLDSYLREKAGFFYLTALYLAFLEDYAEDDVDKPVDRSPMDF